MAADYGKIREENIARYGWDTAVLDLLGHLYSDRTHFIFELMQNAEDAEATELGFELFEDRLEVRHDGRAFTEADVRGVCGVGKSGKAGDLTAIGKFGIGFKSVYAYTRSPRIYSSGERFRIESYVRPFPVEAVDVPVGQTLFVFPFDLDTAPAAVAVGEISAALNALAPRILLFLTHIGRLRVDGVGVTGSVVERRAESRSGSRRRVRLSRGSGRGAQEWLVWHRPVQGLADRSQGPVQGLADRSQRPVQGLADRSQRPGQGLADRSQRPGQGLADRSQRPGQGLADRSQRPGQGLADRSQRPGQGLGERAPAIEIAFRVEDGRLTGCGDAPLIVYFPTEKETFLEFLIQGPFRTTPARDNVPEHDPSNQELARQTAALLADVLRELRAEGRLTVEVLRAMPLDATRFRPGSLFRPLFDAVRDVLGGEDVIPVTGGGYDAAGQVWLTQSAALRRLTGAEDHRRLTQNVAPRQSAGGENHRTFGIKKSFKFVHESITESLTPALWRYLREEIGISELTPEGFAAGLTADFLQEQPDEWIVRLYGFLFGYPGLWRVPKPIIRLEDGSHVVPFDGTDGRERATVYLPGAGESELPTVRRSVADSPAARQFLEALGLSEPDVVAEVLEIILPRYQDADAGELDPARHDADLERVMRALDEAPGGRRQELLERLRQTAFLIGENAGTGEHALMPPPDLYQRTKDLEVYFDGNPDAWFAGDRYGPWLVQLRAMGVRPEVRVRAKPANQLGYVVITVEFGRNERGVSGFDPAAEIDGLEFALGHPSHARSEYVWNELLAPNRRLVAGVVERSVLASFADSSAENVRSAIAAAAEGEAWLPGRDGTFRRPGELSLDDLPGTFTRDEGLAQALGMLQPVVGEAARRLGVPQEVLWGLSAHPELVAQVQRWLEGES